MEVECLIDVLGCWVIWLFGYLANCIVCVYQITGYCQRQTGSRRVFFDLHRVLILAMQAGILVIYQKDKTLTDSKWNACVGTDF